MGKLIKPKNDIHFRLGIIKEAVAVGLDWLSEAFLTYQELRWYETDGRYGVCVAGSERLGEPYGFSSRQVDNHLQFLQKYGLVEHVWCDKKVYRNKIKIWVSTARLSGLSNCAEIIRVLERGKKNTHFLSTINGRINGPMSIKTADVSVETADGSVETADGSVGQSEKEQGRELTNELTNELFVSKETKDIPQNSKNQVKDYIQTKDSRMNQKTTGSVPLEEVNQNALKSKIIETARSEVIGNEPTPQVPATPLPSKKIRVLDENGKVKGGHPLTERAYELWEEIMGQPCKRNRWNSQAGWNMMRAKNKGEEWLKGMITIARECKKDPKADYRASNVANLSDLQKNQEYVLDWYRKKQLEKTASANKSLDFLRGKR